MTLEINADANDILENDWLAQFDKNEVIGKDLLLQWE